MSNGEEEPEVLTTNALSARELEWAINSEALVQAHKAINGNIIRTRFPPEPNGYLHVGHAKSMNMNFSLAFEKLNVKPANRRTIFRYDDTNPDAETAEYIDSLMRDLQWLGWTPERTTYSSNNFQHLHDYAIILIKKGLAYVCDLSKSEMEIQRELAMKRNNARNTGKDPDVEAPIPSADILPGRSRNTSVERNLDLFAKMKAGFYAEGSYTLRLKMDFESSNPNMYDLVAYRIKYTQHPHAGNGWCIYPSYDWTHGICDSLEHIDYSICTLEFETRREPYYWILWALDLYKPNVYEMSRLNLQYTVLSKRKLIKLVDSNYVTGWDDPRMPTVSGMRRRGYTKDIINTFCNDVGATRAMNVVEIAKLHHTARTMLSPTCPRLMGVLDPIKVTITNFAEEKAKASSFTFQVQNSPIDNSMGFHDITLTNTIYIDATDFRLQDSAQYYGLAPNKLVGLKYYGGNLFCNEVVFDETKKKVIELKCTIDHSAEKKKPKTYLSWAPNNSIPCKIRIYNELFTVPEPSDLWEDELNANSKVEYNTAFIDPYITQLNLHVDKWTSNQALQMERFGYFVVDTDTTYSNEHTEGVLIFNRIVTLKEEVSKKTLSPEEEKALQDRRDRAKKEIAEKEIKMKIDPMELFQVAEEYQGKYSQYDDKTGIPTHDSDGTKLTKSATKKLQKEKNKFLKVLAKWNKK